MLLLVIDLVRQNVLEQLYNLLLDLLLGLDLVHGTNHRILVCHGTSSLSVTKRASATNQPASAAAPYHADLAHHFSKLALGRQQKQALDQQLATVRVGLSNPLGRIQLLDDVGDVIFVLHEQVRSE
mgnify:CR=1 FL=1